MLGLAICCSACRGAGRAAAASAGCVAELARRCYEGGVANVVRSSASKVRAKLNAERQLAWLLRLVLAVFLVKVGR